MGDLVPVFPLPNVVLFPHMLLPLHIFEPRYREMTKAALAGNGHIAVALLRPGWEAEYHGRPPMHEIGGLGRILHHAELPDERYNLMLVGVARARLVEVDVETSYRQARVEVLLDAGEGSAGLERRRKDLVARYAGILETLMGREYAEIPLTVLCDVLASILVRDTRERQSLLECVNVLDRHRRLLRILGGAFPRFQEPSLN